VGAGAGGFAYRMFADAVKLLFFRIFLAVVLFFSGANLFAVVDGYLGASASVSQWQMGLASGKTVQLFGLEQQANKPDPLLYTVGLSASLVYNKTWALTYQGEIGTARPEVTFTNVDTESIPAVTTTLSAPTRILRMDHSLAVTRALGVSGFSLFIGAKYQQFGYDQSDGRYTKIQSGAITESNPFQINQSLNTLGPAVGLTYMFRLFGKIFAAAQLGFIYFPGQYTATLSVEPNPGQRLNNQVDEKFYGLGATGLVSVIIPVTDNVLLQMAARGQYYYARTSEGTATVQTTSKTTLKPSTTMDNVQDIIFGGQVAVICKIF
jgi:hypothetical protein